MKLLVEEVPVKWMDIGQTKCHRNGYRRSVWNGRTDKVPLKWKCHQNGWKLITHSSTCSQIVTKFYLFQCISISVAICLSFHFRGTFSIHCCGTWSVHPLHRHFLYLIFSYAKYLHQPQIFYMRVGSTVYNFSWAYFNNLLTC